MLSEKDALIELLTKQNQELLKQIDSLNHQVENLTEIIFQMRKDKFGSSSEKTSRKEIDSHPV